MTEAVMMGLRLAEGLPLSRLRAIGGAAADGLIDARRVEDLVEEGYLDAADGLLRATAAGRERLDAMLGHLLA